MNNVALFTKVPDLAQGRLSFILFLVKFLFIIVFNLVDFTLLRLLSSLLRIKLRLKLGDLICEGFFNGITVLLFELLNDVALNLLI